MDHQAAAAAPGAAPLGNDLDVRWLQKRLEMMTEWHERAEEMLSKVQQLPNHSRRLRHFTENPDIAIPLLQNYDAVIMEKEEQIDELQRQVQSARSVAEHAETDGSQASKNARVAEERAHVAIEEANVRLQSALGEIAQQKAIISQQQTELQSARDSAAHMVTNETKHHHGTQRLEKQLAEKDADIQRFRSRAEELEIQLESAAKKINNLQQNEHSSRNDNEGAKIQLHLVQKENDDKLHEIERLRNKMVAALKQSAENHAAHLRLVEDKHRQQIEQMREGSRTSEASILKLRAQLAHADAGSLATGPNGSLVSQVPSAHEVLLSQAGKAQEAELRRLQSEVTSLQLQRDDAVFRMEQNAAQNRSEVESKVLECKKEVDILKIRNYELEERNNRMTQELSQARDGLRQEREKSRGVAAEHSSNLANRENMNRKLEECRKAQLHAEESLETCRRDQHDAVETERKQLRAAERRVEDARRSEQSAKDKHAAEASDFQRELETLRLQARDATTRASNLQTQLFEKERQVETLGVKSDRLAQGLTAHKHQLQAADERLKKLATQDVTARDELRNLSLHCEQLRMENLRLSRERDRVTRDTEAMHLALRGGN